MQDEYDFSSGKRGAVTDTNGKTRITLFLDDDVVVAFRKRAAAIGIGCQTLINETLRASFAMTEWTNQDFSAFSMQQAQRGMEDDPVIYTDADLQKHCQ